MTDAITPIFLIGYRGTGKSAVARALAERLDLHWHDADAEIEARAGQSIADIFARQGEPAFRELEARVVADLARRTAAVIALGGGAVLREDNRAAIRAAGPVVWLTASVDTISARLAGDDATASRRPNLTPQGGRAEIEAVLAQRTPLYQACATLVIDTEGKSPAEIAEQIITQLRLAPGAEC